MLVLTRRKHEEIVIGDDITISIVEVAGNRVRIGISAPKSIPVNRREVLAESSTTNGDCILEDVPSIGLVDVALKRSPCCATC